VKLAILIVGVLAVAAIAWDAGERHYDNCVEAAIASNPLTLSAADRQDRAKAEWDRYLNDNSPDVETRSRLITDRPRERRKATVEDCSRLP
jgi:hypothetical protein